MNEINIIGPGSGMEKSPKDKITWGFNDFALVRPVTVLFDMHNLPAALSGEIKLGRRTPEQIKKGLNKAKQLSIPVYSLDSWLGCMKYPLNRVKEVFDTDYFSCGVAYAIALALYGNVKRLNIYGIELSIGREYQFQKPCVDYWIGRAHGMGVEVNIYGNSEILKVPGGYLYGYNTKQGE